MKKINRFSACFLAILLIITSLSVSFASAQIEGNFQFEIVTDSSGESPQTYAIVTKYNGSDSVVTVPSTLGGQTVKAIEYAAFMGNASVTSVTVPQSVTSVGDEVFKNCVNLTTLNFPDNITSIGDSILEGTPICENAEYWDNNLLYISKYLVDFDDSKGMTDIKVKDGTTVIARLVFGFSDISSVNLPQSLKVIGDAAFANCENLKSITLPDGIQIMGTGAFSGSGIIGITVPDSVTSMGDYCFDGCKNLTSVTLPHSMERIPADFFAGCSSLKSITIPSSVTLIGFRAFADSGLTSFNIPKNVNEIWDNAFSGCKDLKSFTVDTNNEKFYEVDGVLYEHFISRYTLTAYPAAKAESSYSLPGNVKNIAPYAFDGVTNLKTIILHPNAKDARFRNAYSVEEVIISNSNQDFYSIDGVVFRKGSDSLHYYPPAKKDSAYIIPSDITEIDTISISDNPYLTTLTISEGIENINYGAISDCENLEVVNLPSTLTYIGKYEPIGDCDNLQKINYNGTKAQWDAFGTKIYTNSVNGLYLYTTDGEFELVAPYEEETDFTEITEPTEPSSTAGSNITEPTETTPQSSTSTEPTEGGVDSTTLPADKSDFDLGDVNMDSKLNIRDATLIQKYLAKLADLDEEALSLADFTQDSKVNIKDATSIQKHIVGLN